MFPCGEQTNGHLDDLRLPDKLHFIVVPGETGTVYEQTSQFMDCEWIQLALRRLGNFFARESISYIL